MERKFTLCLFAMLSLMFGSCLKKGEEDPFLSLRSRKARMTGEWEVKNYFYRIESKSGGIWYTYSVTMKDDQYSLSYVDGSNTGIGKGKMTIDIVFDKDGNYQREDKVDGDVYASAGTWDFKSGVGEAKRKSQVVIYIQEDKTPTSNFTWTGNYADVAYDIVELRNKHMKLSCKVTEEDVATGDTDVRQLEMELALKEKRKKM